MWRCGPVPRIACHATPESHCCWLAGKVCEFFDPDPPAGAAGHCSLRTELGAWEAVYADPRYRPVRRLLAEVNVTGCAEWPTAEDRCTACDVRTR